MGIPNEYVLDAPRAQNILDLFKGMWLCEFPPVGGEKLESGEVLAFDDPRIRWTARALGGFGGLRVLELGPCEAAHTYMLERLGARSVVSIEANTYSYLKCLAVIGGSGPQTQPLLLGDFIEYLRGDHPSFDVTLASGVLYHMQDPVELLYLISQTSDVAAIWTHYYDEAWLPGTRSSSTVSGRASRRALMGSATSCTSMTTPRSWSTSTARTRRTAAGCHATQSSPASRPSGSPRFRSGWMSPIIRTAPLSAFWRRVIVGGCPGPPVSGRLLRRRGFARTAEDEGDGGGEMRRSLDVAGGVIPDRRQYPRQRVNRPGLDRDSLDTD